MTIALIIIGGFTVCCLVGAANFFIKTSIIYERMDARWERRPLKPWADVSHYCPHCKRPGKGVCEACEPLASMKPLASPTLEDWQ